MTDKDFNIFTSFDPLLRWANGEDDEYGEYDECETYPSEQVPTHMASFDITKPDHVEH